MSSERMNEVEIIVARHIKNPYYREKFCRDGYAKILLQRLDDYAGCSFGLNSVLIKYADEYIAYINKYDHGLEHAMTFHINNPTGYYFTFNWVGITIDSTLINLIHDYRADFEKCYAYAKSRSLSEPEKEIANNIKDEDQKEKFAIDIEAKTLYNLISMRRCTEFSKEKIDEAIDQYIAFIKDTYGVEVNMDRRRYGSLRIKRNIDCHNSSETGHIPPVHTEPHCYDYNISDALLNELFDWVTLQAQNETNQEARQAYSKVLDAIAVIGDKDRLSRLSIDEKIAVMHFLEDNES
jgi:hypothetical protein